MISKNLIVIFLLKFIGLIYSPCPISQSYNIVERHTPSSYFLSVYFLDNSIQSSVISCLSNCSRNSLCRSVAYYENNSTCNFFSSRSIWNDPVPLQYSTLYYQNICKCPGDEINILMLFPWRAVVALVVLKDGTIATGAPYTNDVKIWNKETGELVKVLVGHDGGLCCVQSILQLRSGLLATGSFDNTVIIWNIETSSIVWQLSNHTAQITSIVEMKNGNIATGAKDSLVIIWNITNGNIIKRLNRHLDTVNCLASLDDGRLVSGGNETFFIVWDQYGNYLLNRTNYVMPLSHMLVLPNNRLIAGTTWGQVILWDTTDFTVITEISKYGFSAMDIYNLNTIVFSNWNQEIEIRELNDLNTIKLIFQINEGTLPIVFYDQQTVAAGCYDGSVRTWRV